MRSLSNFLRSGIRSQARRGDLPIECRPARPQEIRPALGMILSEDGHRCDEAAVLDFLRFALDRNIDLNLLQVAVQNGRISWAVLPVPSPGRTMLLFTPAHLHHQTREPAARRLVDTVCTHYARTGVQLAQVLLDPHHKAVRRLYQSCGFQPMAQLVYLHAILRSDARAGAPLPGPAFSWRTYTPAEHDRLAETIRMSYEGSLDCPALNGLREIEDVISGHKAAGQFDPELWFLLYEAEDPVGTVLVNRVPPADGVELVYLGLKPAARGRGLGDVLMHQALAVAARQDPPRLSLAVDAANRPAMKLYARHGLERIGTKIALLRDLRTQCAAESRPTVGSARSPAPIPGSSSTAHPHAP